MPIPNPLDRVFVGLSGLELDKDYSLGPGIALRRTYAHLMSPFTMAFLPAPPGKHHPAPWRAVRGGFDGVDITAELEVDATDQDFDTSMVAHTLVFLLRIIVEPAIMAPLFASHGFQSIKDLADHEAFVLPFEVGERYFPLHASHRGDLAAELAWIAAHWAIAHHLASKHASFALARSALHNAQTVNNPALILVSVWGALESLFSPATAELKFRVSALIAAYLEPPGETRFDLQKQVAKLYDERSAAAHGNPSHKDADVLSSLALLRRVVLSMIDKGEVPSRADLDRRLFGA